MNTARKPATCGPDQDQPTGADKPTKSRLRLFVLLALAAQAAVVAAEDKPADASGWPAVDKSEWKCRFCAFQTGWSGEAELGAAYVSDDSYKFAEYTGLEKGTYAVANANARYTNPESANRWDVYANNLGFPYRSVEVDGGKQGSYRLRLDYRELPHYISDSAVTPFLGTGGDSLTLPGTWVRAPSTAGMTDLPNSLHEIDIDNTRKQVGVGLSVPWLDWEVGVKARHETRDGTKRIAGAFLTTSAQMVAPVEYTTDNVEAVLSYGGPKLQIKGGYQFSGFSDGNKSLSWQNPFTAVFPGADNGQLALPPDNQSHQLFLYGAYRFSKQTRATANFSVGRMLQDDQFLPATVNTAIASPALPRSSLEGRVDTMNADVKLMSAATEKLRFDASYKYSDRNNQTPQDTFTWVSTDSVVAPVARTNLPYSFTRNLFKVSADYYVAKQDKVSAGVDYDIMDRTYQEVDKTKEGTLWAKYIAHAKDGGDISFQYAYSSRDGSTYHAVSEIVPPENPLMRKYNLADRTRNALGIRATQVIGSATTTGFGLTYANDDYTNSTVGLTSSSDMVVDADIGFQLTKNTTFHVFGSYEQINSQQVGASSLVNPPDWTGKNNDTVGTAGVGLKQKLLAGKLNLGADYMLSRSVGKTTVDNGSGDPPFPDLTSRLSSLKLYGSYQFTNAMSVAMAYWYESYRSQDWQLDGVTPSTINNVLTLGEVSPNYNVNFVSLSVRYRF